MSLKIYRQLSQLAHQGPRAVPTIRFGLRPSISATQRSSLSPVFLHGPSDVRGYASIDLAQQQPLQKTSLYNLHKSHGGKLVPFGGYEMPVQYDDLSVGDSHKWTREKASLFDVGHMVQYHISGPGSTAFLESLTPADLVALPAHRSTLSALLHPETGGICDDTIITRLTSDKFFVVTNAGCREKDAAFLDAALKRWTSDCRPAVEIVPLEHQGLVALQGPLAVEILQAVLAEPNTLELSALHFGSSSYLEVTVPSIGPVTVLASRGGYTGEDGFEISVPPEATEAFAQHLLESAGPDKLRLAGLGARDSLRLEAGMCLYGHDLNDNTTPVEASLSWIIAKSRREKKDFNGAENILAQLVPASKGGAGVKSRRVGLIVDGSPAREGAEVVISGQIVGLVTSGCPSPTLKQNIAMAYVKTGLHTVGTELGVVVRGKTRRAVVTKMPFVPSKYWKGGVAPG